MEMPEDKDFEKNTTQQAGDSLQNVPVLVGLSSVVTLHLWKNRVDFPGQTRTMSNCIPTLLDWLMPCVMCVNRRERITSTTLPNSTKDTMCDKLVGINCKMVKGHLSAGLLQKGLYHGKTSGIPEGAIAMAELK